MKKLWLGGLASPDSYAALAGQLQDRRACLKWIMTRAVARNEWSTAVECMANRAHSLVLIGDAASLDKAQVILEQDALPLCRSLADQESNGERVDARVRVLLHQVRAYCFLRREDPDGAVAALREARECLEDWQNSAAGEREKRELRAADFNLKYYEGLRLLKAKQFA
jgi:hypothetical protein